MSSCSIVSSPVTVNTLNTLSLCPCDCLPGYQAFVSYGSGSGWISVAILQLVLHRELSLYLLDLPPLFPPEKPGNVCREKNMQLDDRSYTFSYKLICIPQQFIIFSSLMFSQTFMVSGSFCPR